MKNILIILIDILVVVLENNSLDVLYWVISFVVTSSISGVIGNLVYDLLKDRWNKRKK